MKTVLRAMDLTARNWLPRLLTQVCRDQLSPFWGSFDRNWWHYRIRDFSSIILQQGGYTVYLASQRAENVSRRESLCRLAAAAARFWNQRALQRGAFEEYYPWEQGYPPLAFSTLAMMKLAAEGVISPDSIRAGAAVAANQLQSRFESQAANQQVAGLAALAWCSKVFPYLVSKSGFESLTRQTLALQTQEGWFEEYGGPDLGYLSVTVDCLWDLLDATGAPCFSASIEQATDCIRRFVSLIPSGSIGMHNARNTDYLVPYGLVRLALQKPTAENLSLIIRLFGDTEKPSHFFNAVDDRYVSHYIGQSLFRAVLLMEQAENLPVAEAVVTNSGPALEAVTESGHFFRQTRDGVSSLVTLRKGGILSHYAEGRAVHDFGWLVRAGGRLYFSHWWSNDWHHGQEGTRLWVTGPLYEQREMASTPSRHIALRMSSLFAGRRLIGLLKKRLIFKKKPCSIQFQRMIEWQGVGLHVVDTFSSVPAGSEFIPAPRSSKRHVASADSFHGEDLQLLDGFKCSREFHPFEQGMEIVTTYLPTA